MATLSFHGFSVQVVSSGYNENIDFIQIVSRFYPDKRIKQLGQNYSPVNFHVKSQNDFSSVVEDIWLAVLMAIFEKLTLTIL